MKPLVGQDVQPPMDTGIIKINFEADANSSLGQSDRILTRMEDVIRKQEGVVYTSSTLGSEPSVVSFGSGKNPQQGTMTVNLVDRYHRKATTWQMEAAFREEFRVIPGLKSADVFDYGAPPMSSIRAAVDVMVTGPDRQVLSADRARMSEAAMERVGGLTSVSLTWTARQEGDHVHRRPGAVCLLPRISQRDRRASPGGAAGRGMLHLPGGGRGRVPDPGPLCRAISRQHPPSWPP